MELSRRGPNAVLALKREGYLKKIIRSRRRKGFGHIPWILVDGSQILADFSREYYRSWSKAAFVHALQRLVPDITASDLVPGGSGVRAQALDRSGKLVDDFYFVYTEGMVHVCNVPSPAATASLAIGRYIVDTVVQRSDLSLNRK